MADGTPRGLLLVPEGQQRRWRFREPPIDNKGGLLRSKLLAGGWPGVRPLGLREPRKRALTGPPEVKGGASEASRVYPDTAATKV